MEPQDSIPTDIVEGNEPNKIPTADPPKIPSILTRSERLLKPPQKYLELLQQQQQQ
jgi:hypothetical protein